MNIQSIYVQALFQAIELLESPAATSEDIRKAWKIVLGFINAHFGKNGDYYKLIVMFGENPVDLRVKLLEFTIEYTLYVTKNFVILD